jgi:ATP-binding cassette subfamily B protein
VSFKYPNRDNWTLHEIVLHISKGESVAVVGSNGAGKSTLIKLLCGLYQPTSGAIYLDGKNLRDWKSEDLLKRMSLVFQDFNKYQLSLQENVGVGEVQYMENEAHVAGAMSRAGANELLSQMPQGLQSPLGNWFKGGVELSGGQWQKIAVSRAFMREDADILILDEPTAALDPEAESLAFEKFHELTKGKTSLIISHRFPIARLADHIVVIEKGEIQEEGSHISLMQAEGRYSQLFKLQAKGYF